MPFSSQFALSVELTRLLPAAGVTAVAAGTALIKLARDLRASGSDIVIEEDLAAVFRQNRIDPKFERQFCNSITRVSRLSTISDMFPIALHVGPGPTVGRALKDPAYMPFVIQTSLLCAVHDIESLCDGLEEALKLRAPPSLDSSLPHSDAMVGVFRAVADQTSGFQWTNIFQEVEIALGVPRSHHDRDRFIRLTVPVLQASLDMMAAVQRLYKSSIMKIDGSDGSVTMVVWAHHLLGLTVHVMNTSKGTVMFGNGEPSVLIEFPDPSRPVSVTVPYLLDESGGIQLKVETPTGADLVDLTAHEKFPARGYAHHVFYYDNAMLSESRIKVMCHYSGALAYLYYYQSYKGYLSLSRFPTKLIPSRNMERAVEFILGDAYNEEQIKGYLNNSELGTELPPSLTLELGSLYLRHQYKLIDKAINLAYIIVAFAAVGDLAQCEDMVLSSFESVIKPKRPLKDFPAPSFDYVFQIIASLLQARPKDIGRPDSQPTMISGWGWTVFYDSLVDCDPLHILPWRIWIQRGIPYSNGRTAHKVIDGPDTRTNLPRIQLADKAGSMLRPRCETNVSNPRYLVSQRGDAFLVSRRYTIIPSDRLVSVALSFYSEVRWKATVIESCLENCALSNDDITRIESGVATVKNFDYSSYSEFKEHIHVSLTAGNKDSQWLALIGSIAPRSRRSPFLRHPEVCVSCFISQASQEQDDVLLIL